MPPAPLSGLTVLDLTRVLSGPYCTMLLADMGARVIKIEHPGAGDETRAWGPPFIGGESAYFLSINRNKESVTLDFKQPSGRALLDRLLDRSDVLVENFRPGTMARAGLGYETIKAARPRLVYCSISGFGQTGPRRTEAGYDAVVQAESGLMSLTGDADVPPYRFGVAVADLVAGLLAAQGIVLALYARERTGAGQQVDIGMLDGSIALLTYHASAYLNAGISPRRLGNRHPTIAPYDTYATGDGEIVLAVGNDDQFHRFCTVADIPALAQDPRFVTNPARVTNYEALRAIIADALRRRPGRDWLEALTHAGVPCGAVRDLPAALADPQVAARDMINAVEHAAAGTLKVLGIPIKLSDTPGRIRSAPPALGQHTSDVLMRDLGLTTGEVETLRSRGVV